MVTLSGNLFTGDSFFVMGTPLGSCYVVNATQLQRCPCSSRGEVALGQVAGEEGRAAKREVGQWH